METLYLVGCGARKLKRCAPARHLYTGALFQKSLALAEDRAGGKAHNHVFILSAMHGLIPPDEMLEPYSYALTEVPVSLRRKWGVRVAETLHIHLGNIRRLGKARIVIYAGAPYAEAVRYGIATHARVAPRIETPMEGLGIGQRHSWLNARLDELGIHVLRTAA